MRNMWLPSAPLACGTTAPARARRGCRGRDQRERRAQRERSPSTPPSTRAQSETRKHQCLSVNHRPSADGVARNGRGREGRGRGRRERGSGERAGGGGTHRRATTPRADTKRVQASRIEAAHLKSDPSPRPRPPPRLPLPLPPLSLPRSPRPHKRNEAGSASLETARLGYVTVRALSACRLVPLRASALATRRPAWRRLRPSCPRRGRGKCGWERTRRACDRPCSR